MSQDLFAAFSVPESKHGTNDPDRNPDQGEWSSFEGVTGFNQTSTETRHQEYQDPTSSGFDDDDFGDFEDASLSSKPWQHGTGSSMNSTATGGSSVLPPKPSPAAVVEPEDPRIGRHPFAANMDLLFSADDDEYDAGFDDLDDLSRNPEAAMAYSKRIIEEQLDGRSRDKPRSVSKPSSSSRNDSTTSRMAHEPTQPRERERLPKDPNVLFDADNVTDESEEDDFGDFEHGPAARGSASGSSKVNDIQAKSVMPSIDLLGLEDGPASSSSTASSHASKVRHSASHIAAARNTRKSPIITDLSRQDTTNQDDAWDDFDEVEPNSGPLPAKASTAVSNVATTTPKPRNQDSKATQKELSPPTNIPPPVMLLSIFPSIFATGREVLFDPLSKLELAERQQLLTHPATIQFLRSYLNHAVVLGHIIAGRKSRWKRDQHLAQSMRIGPASAGGKGGMKLAGVDKSEAAKEDREALDTIRLWKSQIGKLRGAITTAGPSKNPATKSLPSVPEITDPMPVRTLKAVEGGFVAPHACALCGLKREERVAKIDVNINDSFGEWWLDRASMHLVCHDFWVEHKDKLRSR